MWKPIVIMLFATMILAVGNGLLSKGLHEVRALYFTGPFWSVALGYAGAVIHHPRVLIGICCHIIFFSLLLLAFSVGDLSLVVPVSAFDYIFSVFIARYYLGETVPSLRWIGVAIILVGVMTVVMSAQKPNHSPEPQKVSISRADHRAPQSPAPEEIQI